MSVRHGTPVRWVKPEPAKSRQIGLGPGRQMAFAIDAFGFGLIARDKPRRDAKTATGGDEQHGEITTGPGPRAKRLLGGLGIARRSDMAMGPAVERFGQKFQKPGHIPGLLHEIAGKTRNAALWEDMQIGRHVLLIRDWRRMACLAGKAADDMQHSGLSGKAHAGFRRAKSR